MKPVLSTFKTRSKIEVSMVPRACVAVGSGYLEAHPIVVTQQGKPVGRAR